MTNLQTSGNTRSEYSAFLDDSVLQPEMQGALTLPSLPLGTGDFTIALNARWMGDEAGSGDLVTQFDARARRGITLGVSSLGAACGTQTHRLKLSFGIDAGTDPDWTDLGNPGGNTVFPFALCEFKGAMYVAVLSSDAESSKGAVYRHDESKGWVDCGCPCRGNAVTAMVVLDGMLYVAASCYDPKGTHLAAVSNMEPDGRIFAYDGVNWTDCGKPSDCAMTGCMATLNGQIYATMLHQYTNVISHPENGLYRMVRQGEWEFCGNPGARVAPIIARGGRIIAGGFDGGEIYTYDSESQAWENWGKPPFEETSQIYSFVEYKGEILAGTWKVAKVFAVEGPHRFRDLGTMGNELEVMPMALFNGKLYAGTLPLAQIYRFEDEEGWQLIDRLDHTHTQYRRIYAMAVSQGWLYCGAVPSGHIFRMRAGDVVSTENGFPSGWHHVTAVRRSNRLSLYIDGQKVAEQSEPPHWLADRSLDLTSPAPLCIGNGPAGPWKGELTNGRIYPRALSEEEVSALASQQT